jgi:Ser/Thr protein kinase RdoA (MazF antagonist)
MSMTDVKRPRFELHELLDEYGLGAVQDARIATGGEVNENWIVRTTKETVVVRCVAPGGPLRDVQFEHSLIKALGRCRFPYQLPRPLRTKMGRTIVAKDGGYIWLYKYIEGTRSRPSREEVIEQIAHAMATMHKSSRKFSLPRPKRIPMALEDLWLLRALRQWQLKLLSSLDGRCRFFGARVQECISLLEKVRCTNYRALPHFPIHGDVCMANLVFSHDLLTGIIDFGHCCSDTAIRDITIALRYECVDRRDRFKLDFDAARHFLRTYRKVHPLSRTETDLIPAVAMADSADLFWWRIFEIASNRSRIESMHAVERPFKALQWYSQHGQRVARALRM